MATGNMLALAVAALVLTFEHAHGARVLASSRSLVQLVEPMGAGKTFGTLQGAPGGSKYGALQHQQAADSGSADSSGGASGSAAASAGGLVSSGSSSTTGGATGGTVSTPTSQGTSSSTFNTGSPVPVRRNTPNPASDSSQSNADSTNAASNNPF